MVVEGFEAESDKVCGYNSIFSILILYTIICDIGSSQNLLYDGQEISDVCWGNSNIYVEPSNIPLLLYYFRSCLHEAEMLDGSDRRRLVNTLLTRISSTLPEIKNLYYNGDIENDVINDIHDLLREIKFTELSYNDQYADISSELEYNPVGRSHRSPPTAYKINPLQITASSEKEQEHACDSLIFKNVTVTDSSSRGKSLEETAFVVKRNQLVIPTPVISVDSGKPRSIAVPLKDHSIYDVNDPKSDGVLVRYYVTAMKCLTLPKRYTKTEALEFNNLFCTWIEYEIVPRVHEYYPAFDGVLQILKTMEDHAMATDCIDRIKHLNEQKLKSPKTYMNKVYQSNPHNVNYLLHENKSKKTSLANDTYDDLVNTEIKNNDAIKNGEEVNLNLYKNELLHGSSTCKGTKNLKDDSQKSFKNKFSELHQQNFLEAERSRTTDIYYLAALTEKVKTDGIVSKVNGNTWVIMFAFFLALLLATWIVIGTFFIACCIKRAEKCRKGSTRRSESSRRSSFGVGGVSHTNYDQQTNGSNCPYEEGESVIIMMKGEDGGDPQYYYGTFHVDKNKKADSKLVLGENIQPEHLSQEGIFRHDHRRGPPEPPSGYARAPLNPEDGPCETVELKKRLQEVGCRCPHTPKGASHGHMESGSEPEASNHRHGSGNIDPSTRSSSKAQIGSFDSRASRHSSQDRLSQNPLQRKRSGSDQTYPSLSDVKLHEEGESTWKGKKSESQLSAIKSQQDISNSDSEPNPKTSKTNQTTQLQRAKNENLRKFSKEDSITKAAKQRGFKKN